jgi:hypothetical protein
MELNFDWKTLERKPMLPAGLHPKTWPKWGMPRADGREVDLESMHQGYLYAGDLLGRMSHPEDRLERVIKKASSLNPWITAPVVIIPPVLLEYSMPGRPAPVYDPEKHLGLVTLPRVFVIAELRSHRPARDKNECFSSLIVVWFQENFGDVAPEIQQKIAELDWNKLAWDWAP